MIRRLVVFGASGDLTGRFLLPALAQLSAAGELPDDFAVLGAARKGWDDNAFRRHADEQLEQHGADVPARVRKALVDRLRYRPVDVRDHGSVGAVIGAVSDGQDMASLVAYLALPSGLIPPAVTALGAAGLPPESRIAVEKPFGEDLQGARDLNALLAAVLGEDWEQAVFRVDHALGMTTVQNLLPLRFANRVPEALLNSEHVAEIEVLWEETLGMEGRAGFYDRAGALKDVMQNHMMQVFCMVAMQRPDGGDDGSREMFPAHELRQRKLELLRAVRELSVDDVVRTSRRARYTAGRLADSGGADGRQVPDYAAEAGVNPDRNTETFAEVVLAVDNERWSGTRFRLRAGKALAARRKGILVRLRSEPPLPFQGGTAADDSTYGDRLWIGVDGPNDLSLSLKALSPQGSPGLAPLTLTGRQPESSLSPYAHVLLNLLQGRSNLSVGSEGAEQAWRILTPVRQAWDRNLVPMEEYPAGSEGPSR
jgi:glucose-6-phosphate 1-dehydrogenase